MFKVPLQQRNKTQSNKLVCHGDLLFNFVINAYNRRDMCEQVSCKIKQLSQDEEPIEHSLSIFQVLL